MPAAIDLRKRLAEIDTQIKEHRRTLHVLEQSRTALERELHATATFPVLDLPVEIAAKIFVHCLPPSAKLGWYRFMREYEHTAPLVLTSVCRTWRGITLTTPALWTTLDVSFDVFPSLSCSKPASGGDFIDRWLARAGNHPLSFIFRAMAGPLPTRLRDLIHNYSRRLQSLELYTTEPRIRVLGLDAVQFPLLESASLNCDVPGFSWNPQPLPVNAFINSPRLRELVRHLRPRDMGKPMSRLNLRVALPWGQLTKYDGPIFGLALFSTALNLTELSCYLDFLEEGLVPVTHPGLRSLTLKSVVLLPYLTLPALQYLDLADASDSTADGSEYDLERTFEPFLMRSSPPLVSLRILADDRHFEVWGQYVDHMNRTLETIQFHGPSTRAMSSLFPSEGKGDSILTCSVFSNLRALQLQAVSCDVESHYYALVRFLYTESHLRSFSLVWATNPFLDSTYDSGLPEATPQLNTIRGHLGSHMQA